MIQAIKTVAIYVADQQKALDFYTQVLGFEIRRRQSLGPQGDWIEVAPPGGQTGLVLYPRSLMPSWEELKPSLVFQCDNVEATCKELALKGVAITGSPRVVGWGIYAKFADPDGNEFLLTTPRTM